MEKKRKRKSRPVAEASENGEGSAAVHLDPAIGRLHEGWLQMEDNVRQLESELSLARADRERLAGNTSVLEQQLVEYRSQIDELRSQTGTLQAALGEARRRMDEVASTTAARGERGKIEQRLADYRDALLGLEHALAERDRTIQGHAEEKAALATRIGDLERQFAEVTGRWRESEAANERLQFKLAEAARNVERSEGELRQQRETSERANRRLAEKASLRKNTHVADQARLRELNAALAQENQRRGELAAQLEDREKQLATIESRFRQHQNGAQAELQKKVSGLADELARVTSEAERTQGERDELTRALENRDAVLADLRSRLTEIETQRDELAKAIVAEKPAGEEKAVPAGMQRSAEEPEKRRQARLVVAYEGDHTIKYPLYKAAMIIGRANDADIHVIGRFTSRRHARILLLDDETAVVEDLGSLNGIRVNDQTVTRQPLHDGDMLDIGGARLQFIDLAVHQSA